MASFVRYGGNNPGTCNRRGVSRLSPTKHGAHPITCRLAKLYDEAILSDQLGHAESVDGVRSRLRLPMLDVDLCAELHCQLVASACDQRTGTAATPAASLPLTATRQSERMFRGRRGRASVSPASMQTLELAVIAVAATGLLK
jgi:hypothetical protein